MKLSEVVAQTIAWLQREGRVSYRALKREFALDDEFLEDLKAEIIDAKRLASDENGKVLVWTGPPAAPIAPRGSQPGAEQGRGAPRSTRAEGERRQLTVMFCDLVGSTALSTELDPEELRDVVRAYQHTCAAVISRFDGHLAKYLGDGLLVYFGYPRAHEDDAQRAVRAGLGIVEQVSGLRFPVPGKQASRRSTSDTQHPAPDTRLSVRIGIHTGLVVTGEMGGGATREALAIVGETPNIAARLQEIAAPDTVVISTATNRLIQGYFESQELGPHTLKGISTPVRVYQVLGESGVQSRFEVMATAGLTPLVGREQEFGLLLERWERVKDGEGQVVLLSGEAGIGKSRLVQELKERVAAEGCTRIEFRCSPYYENTAFYPVIEHLQRFLQFQRDDSPSEKLDKLEATLAEYRLPSQDAVPLFAALLSLAHPESHPPLTLSPAKQKQKTQEALSAWLLAEAERRPVLAAWEDVHWADPSTLELHGLLLDQAPTARILTILTFRPEFSPPWSARSHVARLSLNRLGHKQIEAIVAEMTGRRALPPEVVRQIVAKTDGVPLFVEELTKMVVESGFVRQTNGHYELTGPLPALAIPATLQDSLMARLDRLAPVREVAQMAAILGREFSYELLQSVSALDETSLQQALANLVEAEVLYQRGVPPQARYIFKHALIQDAAYQSLLKSERQRYHSLIAQVLEERFVASREGQPELLAHHYTEAGLIAPAISYWREAGQQASQRSANVEAVNHLMKALELLQTLPQTPERAQQELTLQLALGSPLQVTKGWASPDVERAYTRARELSQQVGETSQLFRALWGIWLFYYIRAECQTARALAEQLLRIAENAQDPTLVLEGHHALWPIVFSVGELAPTQMHIDAGMALYDPHQHRAVASLYGGHDAGVCGLNFAALALWFMGYPDQARQKDREAFALAKELAHPYSLALNLYAATRLRQHCGERQVVQERAEELIALCSEQGFALYLEGGIVAHGWALTEAGRGEEGIVQLRRGLAAYEAIGAQLVRPYFLALLASAHAKMGQFEEGLQVLTEALAQVDKTGERYYEAELNRLKGELLLGRVESRQSRVESHGPRTLDSELSTLDSHEAEACFRKAVEIARRQSAKSLELRAAMSLARLRQRQGRREEARKLLAEVYDWFTEGFDTKDLQDAQALLKELT